MLVFSLVVIISIDLRTSDLKLSLIFMLVFTLVVIILIDLKTSDLKSVLRSRDLKKKFPFFLGKI